MPVHAVGTSDPSIILARLDSGPTKCCDLGRHLHQPASEFRIMIAVWVEDTVQPQMLANWRQWLATNMPSVLLSTQISIEGAFHGNSTILLLALLLEM